ncbi:hypothetical protein [Aminobacter sp. BE322]
MASAVQLFEAAKDAATKRRFGLVRSAISRYLVRRAGKADHAAEKWLSG